MADDEIEKILRAYGQECLIEAAAKAKAFDIWTKDAPVGFAKVSREGVFEKVNTTLCRFLQKTEVELLGSNFKTITPSPLDDWDIAMVQRVINGEIEDYILPKVYQVGMESYVFAVVHPVGFRNQKGEFSHFWVLIIPTTKEEVIAMQKAMVGKVILPPELYISQKRSLPISLMKFASKYQKEATGLLTVIGLALYAIYKEVLKGN